MIRHRCPVCDGLLMHSPATAGATVACSHCRSLVEVPREGTISAAEMAERSDASPKYLASGEPSRPLIDRIGAMLGTHVSAEAPGPMGAGKRVMYGLLGLFLLVLFVGFGIYGAYSFVQRAASDKWATTEGKVEDADVSEKVGRTSRGRRTVEYSTLVRYTYKVSGKEHTSARVAFGPDQNYSFLAKAMASQYKPEQKVTVYYDPARPDQAVLRREVLFGGYLFTVVGVFVSFVGLRLLLTAVAPTTTSSNSRWLPWSRRFTWVDLPVTALGIVGLALWAPMLFGV